MINKKRNNLIDKNYTKNININKSGTDDNNNDNKQ